MLEDASRRGVAEVQKGANPRRRTALGRGLNALMSSSVAVELTPGRSEARPLTEVEDPVEGNLFYLPVDRITPNRAQPRQHFDEGEIAALSESIRTSGLLQPILVRRQKGDAGHLASYELIAGERRWRAAQDAGLRKLPAIVKQLSDREALELAIVENVQRSDLNPIEEARAYARLINDFGATQEEVAASVGRDRTSIANTLRLLRLPSEIQQLLAVGKLSAGHGRALLMLQSEDEQKSFVTRIMQDGLSVRVVEQLAQEKRRRPAVVGAPTEKGPRILELEERLRRALGTKVSLSCGDGGKGELRIAFYSESELESLLDKLGA